MNRSCIAAVVVGALALAGPLASTAHAATHPASATDATSRPAHAGGRALLGANQVTLGDRVPWGRVGRGWYLTLISQGPHGQFGIRAEHQLLDLVDPLGGRYQLTKSDVARDGSGYRQLEDWSSDGRRALVLVGSGTAHARAITYDLPAGTHHVTRLDRRAGTVAFAPGGALYGTEDSASGSESVVRHDPDGSTHVLARRTSGHLLASPNGRRVVTDPYASSDHTLTVLTPSGREVAEVPVPGTCSPVRWQGARTVLASCFRSGRGIPRLFAVPLDGSAVRAVSAFHGRHSPDLGDLDARRLDGTTYLEASGPCGVVFLGRQHPDGSVSKVDVPGTTANVYLLGTRHDRLVLQAGVSCDGGGSRAAITHFDPRTRVDRVVALLPVNEDYDTIRGWREPRTSF